MSVKTPVRLFLAAEAALYLAFLARDLAAAPSSGFKYASIVLCLLMSLFLAARGGDRLLPASMAFTLLADTFLLLLDAAYGVGVGCFCIVQAIYLICLCRNGGRPRPILRLGLFAAAVVLLSALGLWTPLNLLVFFYFSSFVCNVLEALRLPDRLFALGLLLFLLCDVCVGIFNAPGLFPAPLFNLASFGMWLFYLPGQVLIVLSGSPEKAV